MATSYKKYISLDKIIIIVFKQFVDREIELKWLNRSYKQKYSSFLILYGRRRVGKTELLKHFSKDKDHIYFLATTKTERENLKDLQNVMANFLKDELFRKVDFIGWEDLFKEFTKRTKKIIIIIDEFPYLIELNKAILSIFQRIWDENLKDKQIMLILCGSSIGMMETEVLGYRSPLYGRRTGQWKVEPFKFRDLKLFFPKYGFEDRLMFYSFLDGIPHYLNQMDTTKTPLWNIQNKVLKRGEYLYEEAENLLRQEFREPRNYFSILHAIADGNTKYGEICNKTELDKPLVSQYLKNLINLHIVKKEYPITQKKETRNTRYELSDNYYDFWFKFVYPNKSLIEEDKHDILMKNIKEKLTLHYSKVFEQVCREIVFDLHNLNRIGRWWYKDKEIDIVGLNEQQNMILFGECKWSKRKIGMETIEDLEKKSREVRWKNHKRREIYVLFSKSGFTEDIKSLAQNRTNLQLYDVDRLEKLYRRT